jgi:hypothetical protein
MKSASRPRHRPSETVPFPALKNKLRIYLSEPDVVANLKVDWGKTRRLKSGVVFTTTALPVDEYTFTVDEDAYKKGEKIKTYKRTRYYPRSAVVIAAELEASEERYIDIPAGTPVFLCMMNELGRLSSIGNEYSGKNVTVIINPPTEETVKKYMKETE